MKRHDSARVAEIHRELHSHLPAEPALRLKAIESLLVGKGMVDPAAIDAWMDAYSEEIGPRRGALLVARSWLDGGFRERLLDDAPAVLREVGFDGWAGAHLRVVANDASVHNVVVCTLCSCYPHSVLGMPPGWYKSAAYRARVVRDPRGVLAEFGVTLDDDVEVRVWDSTSELRYLVAPERPPGTEGWDEARLAAIVTRDSMIGTQRVLDPAREATS